MFDFSRTSNAKRLLEFATLLKQLSDRIGFRVSSRGWCYILEQNGAINKDQFDKVETWVNRCRRRGILPIDFVAEEDARKFQGIETPADISPVADLEGWIDAVESSASHYAVDWWVGEEYYIQMVVEKIDLVTLFRPVCAKYHIPIANSKGWSSMLQRAEYARRFHEAEEKGLKCVLLYCGDHDPDGLRISEFLRKNLRDLRDIRWADGTEGYDPGVGSNPWDLKIHRFGLNFDFIEEHGFTWIDNLITGSGKNLASPSHKNHYSDYVQDYLSTIGARKCEANVLVTDTAIARQLCRSAIESFLGQQATKRFQARRKAVQNYVGKFFHRSGFAEAIASARESIDNEMDLMEGETWLI